MIPGRRLSFEALEPRRPLAADAFEDNDSLNQVSALPLGPTSANFGIVSETRVIGALSLDDASDYYRVETTALGTTHDFVQIDFANGQGNLDLELLDSLGNTVRLSSSATSNSERVTFGNVPAGEYFIRVFNFPNPNYTLTVNPPGNEPDDEYEPNDSPSQVSTLPPGGLGSANLGVVNADLTLPNLRAEDGAGDWFRIQTVATGTTNDLARIDFISNLGDLNLALYDSLGNLLTASTAGYNDYDEVSFYNYAPGVYFLHVFGGWGSNEIFGNANYTLTLRPPKNGSPPLQPEIAVQQSGIAIANESSEVLRFSSTPQGQMGPQLTFTVMNQGATDLQLGAVQLPLGFTLVEPLATTLGPGNSDSFTVRLDTAIVGSHVGQIRFVNNDADESIFAFAIGGVVTPTTNTASGDVFEQNDDRFTVAAQPPGAPSSPNFGVLLDTLVLPQLQLDDASDYYRVETTALGTTHDFVQIDFANGQGNLDLELLDSLGNTVRLSSSATSNSERVTFGNVPAGEYFIRVFNFPNPNYTLTVNPPGNEPDDEYEPNDSPSQVSTLPPGGLGSANLGVVNADLTLPNLRAEDGAGDWFRIQTVATGTTNDLARIDFISKLGDLNLALYDSLGNLLTASTAGYNDYDEVSFYNYAPGVYFLHVFGGWGSNEIFGNANYTLTLRPPKVYLLHNETLANDVDGDSDVDIDDAILVIQYLRRERLGGGVTPTAGPPYLDTTRDNHFF